MKNLFLTLLLITLIVFAYFHEEVGKSEELKRQTISKQVIKFEISQIDKITLPNCKLIKINNNWKVGDLNFQASLENVEKLLTIIHSIHKLDKVELSGKSEKDFFKFQDYKFSIESFGQEWKFRLGDVSELTGNFYLQELNTDKKEIYTVKDTSSFEGLYKTELELFLNQYIRFKNYILAPANSYIESRVFYDDLLLGIQSIKVDNKWNRWFEVDAVRNETYPKALKGIKYRNLSRQIKELISTIKFKKLLKPGVFGDQTSQLEIKRNDKVVKATLYNSLDGKAGNFLLVQGHEWVYLLSEKSESLFFQNVQQFWDKRLHFDTKINEIKRIDFELSSDDDKYFKFFVDDLDKFKFKWKTPQIKSINVENFNFLFHLILGLDKFSQAKLIKEGQVLENSNGFELYMRIFDKDLIVKFYDKDLVIVNITDNYQLHFDYSFAGLKIRSVNDFFALN